MKHAIWNPWHGCQKYSEGCQNCYMFRRDQQVGRDPTAVSRTKSFGLPLARARGGGYKVPAGSTLYACMTSDFFLEQADAWRPEVWRMIAQRPDVQFIILTKRIMRFADCLPSDWGAGYANVAIGSTMENQRQLDARFPIFAQAPIAGKYVICEPLLSDIDMHAYLSPDILQVVVGGESGPNARVCDFNWVLHIRAQCIEKNVPFYFKQTGANFKKDGKLYKVPRKLQHSQARRAGINTGLERLHPMSGNEVELKLF